MHFLSPASSMSDRSVILKMMTEKMSAFCNRENIFIWYLKVSYLWIHENIYSQVKLMDDCNSLQKIKKKFKYLSPFWHFSYWRLKKKAFLSFRSHGLQEEIEEKIAKLH